MKCTLSAFGLNFAIPALFSSTTVQQLFRFGYELQNMPANVSALIFTRNYVLIAYDGVFITSMTIERYMYEASFG